MIYVTISFFRIRGNSFVSSITNISIYGGRVSCPEYTGGFRTLFHIWTVNFRRTSTSRTGMWPRLPYKEILAIGRAKVILRREYSHGHTIHVFSKFWNAQHTKNGMGMHWYKSNIEIYFFEEICLKKCF